GEMAAGLAHEINNPVAIISAKCQLIEQELERPYRSDSSIIRGELAKIEKNIQRISGIIRGLRSFARSGENDRLEWVSLEELLKDLRELCESRLLQQEVVCDWPETKGFEILCRPVQIHQILVNLICNAIDAVENKIEKRIWLNFLVHSDGALLRIANSGDPIPEQIREKMWQPFFTTKEVNRGTGLGLSISLGLARDNRMDLELVPDLTRTEFQLSIPKNSIRKNDPRIRYDLQKFSDGLLD
ncbi:MAG: ATP-binding protein, partial [Bdellovibrio sp.]